MQKLVVLSVVGAVVVGCAAVFLLLGGDVKENKATSTPAAPISKQKEIKTEPKSGTASLESLLAMAEDLECSINYRNEVDTSSTISGTYFTSRGKMRGDFIVPDLATGSVSSMIVKDNTMYSWSVIEGQSYGVKIDMGEYAQAKLAGKAPDTKNPVPLDTPVAYDCKPWVGVDASVFETPKDVLFRDFAEVVNMGMEFGNVYTEVGVDNSAQCALCDQVAGASQAECKAAFKCQ